jgi:outer membrane protein TolC
MKIRLLHFILFFLISFFSAKAQQTFSLREAVNYAIKNHVNIKNAQLDIASADARVWEIKAAGLPQINANVGYTGNIQRAGFVLPKEFGGGGFQRFGNTFAGNAGVNFNQLVFNGSYTLGLKAADVYKELSQKSMSQTKQQIAENVIKAYYSILVNEERMKILALNIGRLDSTFRETKILNEKGFVELIDVQRLEVQLNNLKTELWKVQELQRLSYDLLKFQMGMDSPEVISLKDKLTDIKIENFLVNQTVVNYNDRPEYSILQTQKHLQELDFKNAKAGALPTVSLSGNYGYNGTGNNFTFSDGVGFDISAVSLNMNIPIFDGNARKYKMAQKKQLLEKTNNTFKFLESSITLQVTQANTMLKNSIESLNSQKRNMELAKEVVRVTKAKYQQGLGSNLEVVNAESSLKEAQTNYFTSLYDLLIAKVDLDKALGKLEVE